MHRTEIETELRRRAESYKPQTHLIANYYRVRRKVAYPLPIREIYLPAMPVPGIQTYPWATWMTWDLEERIHSLGCAATWFRACLSLNQVGPQPRLCRNLVQR